MPTTERVTITLPADLVESIDRLERNRSRFIRTALEHEIARRRREGLLRSLEQPHPEAVDLADAGLDEWAEPFPDEDERLVDPAAGKPVRWVEGGGWRLDRGPAVNLDRGTVVLVTLDPTVGHEQRGQRPCVAVSDPSVNAVVVKIVSRGQDRQSWSRSSVVVKIVSRGQDRQSWSRSSVVVKIVSRGQDRPREK
jgi:hypothetical protein